MWVSPGILFGLVALFGWGIADFLAKQVIDRTGDLKAFFWMQLLSMLPFFALYFIADGRFAFPLQDYLMFLLISLTGVVGYFLFYKAMKLGDVSVMSPIQASNFVVTVILAVIFLKEILVVQQIIAMVFVFTGLVFTGIHYDALRRFRKIAWLPGVKENAVSACCIGLHLFLIGLMVPKYGWLAPIFFFRVFNVMFLLLYTHFSRKEVRITISKRDRFLYWLFLLIVLFDVAAILGFSLGVNSAYVSIVAPVAVSFPLVTVTLAAVFYKERLEKIQVAGILLLILGIVMLSVFS